MAPSAGARISTLRVPSELLLLPLFFLLHAAFDFFTNKFQIVLCVFVVRVYFKRLFVIFDGLGKFPLAVHTVSEIVVGLLLKGTVR